MRSESETKFILLTIDSLRKDRLSYFRNDRNTTPFLDSIISDNIFYSNAYSASCHTREAMPSILTGEDPKNCVDKYRISSETIAEKLSEKGVETKAYLSGPFLTESNGYHRGFKIFNTGYRTGRTFPEYLWKIIRDKHFRSGYQLNELIENSLQTNTFVWTHYMDIHAPYNMFENWIWGEQTSDRNLEKIYRKAKYLGEISEEQHQLLVDAYDNSLRHLDNILKDLFSRLDEEFEFIILGDHGESFGENGNYEHDFPRTLDDPRLEIPIIESGAPIQHSRRVSTLDIFPEVLHRFGFKEESGFSKPKRFQASCKKFFGRKVRCF